MQIHDVSMTFLDQVTGRATHIRWFAAGETAAQARAAAFAAVKRECAHEIRGMELVGKLFSTDAPGRSSPGRRQRLTSDDLIARGLNSGATTRSIES